MMGAADVLRFLRTEFAHRDPRTPAAAHEDAARSNATEPGALPIEQRSGEQLKGSGRRAADRRAADPGPEAPEGARERLKDRAQPRRADPPSGRSVRDERKRLADLDGRVRAAQADDADGGKRRRLAHEAQFLYRSAVVDAYASLLEELHAGPQEAALVHRWVAQNTDFACQVSVE